MRSKFQYPYLIIRLDPDEPILESLISICKHHSIHTGVIISGIGQLKHIDLGYFKEKDNYLPEHFSETYELLSISGTMIQHKQSFLPHIHVLLGAEDKTTIGGHLLQAFVETTNEILILDLPVSVAREKKDTTGLMGLKI